MFGALLEVERRKICTTSAGANDLEVKIVKNWRSWDVFGGWKCVSRGRRRDFDTLQNTWQAQEFVRLAKTLAGVVDLKRLRNDAFRVAGARICAFWYRCLKVPKQNPWKGCKFPVTEVLFCSDHFAWQLQEFVCLGSTFSWQAQYFRSMHLKIAKTYWNSEVKCLLNMSILKEVSQKRFVFELQSFVFEGSLAEMLRFSSWKLQFWRKSRKKASFLSFKASFLKEVSQKCLVFVFKASFLKEVSQKCLVFDLQSFIFEGSLAEKLRFWASKLQFWRKSRKKASFLSFKAFFWRKLKRRISNQLTTNSFESQIDWQPNHLNLRSIDNRIIWISNHLTTTSLEVQINRQPKSFEAHIDWQPNHLNLKSIDNQINWISNLLTTKIIWISNQMTTKSFDSQLVWIWHQLTFEPLELRTPPSYRFLIFGNFRHRLVR